MPIWILMGSLHFAHVLVFTVRPYLLRLPVKGFPVIRARESRISSLFSPSQTMVGRDCAGLSSLGFTGRVAGVALILAFRVGFACASAIKACFTSCCRCRSSSFIRSISCFDPAIFDIGVYVGRFAFADFFFARSLFRVSASANVASCFFGCLAFRSTIHRLKFSSSSDRVRSGRLFCAESLLTALHP